MNISLQNIFSLDIKIGGSPDFSKFIYMNCDIEILCYNLCKNQCQASFSHVS